MRPERQSGFALATAIFLVVVLAALGLVILSVSGLQHVSSARDVMGSKAYQAARAGIEWGAYRVLQQGLPGNCPAASTTFAMPAGDLAGFTVTVTCVETNNDEGSRTAAGGTPLEFYVITSTACNQAPCPNSSPGAAYVERQIQATIGR
jgi:MSHA biogenesis protein MshP